jgi:hypothetical protein
MSDFIISGIEVGRLNALVKNIMKQTGASDPNEAVRLVNSGEWTICQPARCWREQDGIIYFSVTSDGTTGEEWITRLEGKGFRISDYAKSILRSDDFKPTNGITTEIAVLKGMLFTDSERITKSIRAEADKRKLVKPNAEVACLIREMFTDKEIEAMGLWWIIAMHEPINDSDGGPDLLDALRRDDGRWLSADCGEPDGKWYQDSGFAFAVAQVSAQDLVA